MDCPHCKAQGEDGGPYRGASARHLRRESLKAVSHEAGVEIDRCDTCGGVWLDDGEMRKVEMAARARVAAGGDAALAALLQRTYARARREERAPISCPRCNEELFEREWGFRSQVMVDVCIECQGVWLDADELEQLEEFFSARLG
jgi:Zn-finger nucleic acid-binding protein